MEPRFNLLDSATAAKLVKRFYNASLALDQSTWPKALRQLVDLRVSQINGCAFCTDLHAKEADDGRRVLGPAQPGRRLARVHRVHRCRAGSTGTRSGGNPARRRAPRRVRRDWTAVRKHYDDDQIGRWSARSQ